MEINKYFIKLLQSIKAMDGLDFFMGKGKLSQTEFRLLLEIVLEGEKGKEIISSELARRLGITRSAVSQIVTKLEEKDVVKRVGSSTDKKIAYVKLSDKALAVFDEQGKRVNMLMESVVKEFGEDRMLSLIAEYDAFSAVFNRVRNEMGDEKKDSEHRG